MKKILLSAIICFFAISFSFAQYVSAEEASEVANAFFKSQNLKLSRCSKVVKNDNQNLLYIFDAENAFVVISGNKSCFPVLAFVEHQLYDENNAAEPFKMWLNHYVNQVEESFKNQNINQKNINYWNRILEKKQFRSDFEIEPLMLSKWDQGKFYNYYCPKDPSGPNGRVVTGCVATALAQLIYYYRFPNSGVGEYSYTDANYGVQYANYGDATYNFDEMCDEPSAINTEICKLIYHCGVGVDMVYGPNGSGMFNHSAAKVLRTYFKYSSETEYLYRDSTNLDWDSVIVNHLQKRMPLYYAGWSNPNINGHGFICDGYKMVDSNYFYHFNFGWSGSSDGYYYTNALNVGGSHFNLAQELIINAYPDTVNYQFPENNQLTGTKTLTSLEGTFSDGSFYDANYAKNMNFTWNISPNSNNINSISVRVTYSISDGDTLKIFDPETPYLIYSLTADTGSLSFMWSVQSLVVNFVSDNQSEDLGFRLHYTANQEEFCGTQTFSSQTGHIEDGSGDAEYNNLSDCKFSIILPQYTAIRVHINSLNLEENHDYLHFYKNANVSPNNLMLSLTGNLSDTTLVFDFKRLTIVFETDESGTAAGFDLDYEGGFVGIDEYEDKVAVYPNPAHDNISIHCEDEIYKIEIFNFEGKTIKECAINSNFANISLTEVQSGLYFAKIYTNKGVIIKKITKIS